MSTGLTSVDGYPVISTNGRWPAHSRYPATLRQVIKDCVTGLSLANLIMLRVWSALLTKDVDSGYTLRHPPRPVDFAAAIFCVSLLAASYGAVAAVARRFVRSRAVAHWGAALSIVLVANAVRQVVTNSASANLGATLRDTDWHTVAAVALLGVSVLFGVTVVWGGRLARIVSIALLVCSPFVLVTFAEAAFGIVRYNPAAYADKKLAAPVQFGMPQRRILWIIFDEMDERLTFVDRDPTLRLPEFDKFRGEAFSAVAAQSPDRITITSVPSLLTGEQVTGFRTMASDDLLITYGSGRTAHWQDEPNLFTRARQSGFDGALAGWYHPYGRVLNRSLTDCAWVELPNFDDSAGETLWQVSMDQLRTVVETRSMSPFGQSLAVRHQVRNYNDILAHAKAYSTNPRLGVIFLHFPIPHRPYIYDSRTGRLDLNNSPGRGYIDALALADRTFGELRRTMESAGLWDRTAVLISADHGYRGARSVDGGKITDRWVPFLLKLPGRHEPFEYRPLLETVRSADLLLEILQGRLTTPAEVAAWLDRLRSQAAADNCPACAAAHIR